MQLSFSPNRGSHQGPGIIHVGPACVILCMILWSPHHTTQLCKEEWILQLCESPALFLQRWIVDSEVAGIDANVLQHLSWPAGLFINSNDTFFTLHIIVGTTWPHSSKDPTAYFGSALRHGPGVTSAQLSQYCSAADKNLKQYTSEHKRIVFSSFWLFDSSPLSLPQLAGCQQPLGFRNTDRGILHHN